MKSFSRKARNAIFLLASLLLLLAGCANPLGFSPKDEAGPSQDGILTVKFSLSSDSDSSPAPRAAGIRPTIYPQGDPDFFKPDYYVITAIDPNGGWRNFGSVQPSQAAQGISGFFEGYWFIDVKAYVDQASEDLLIAAGSTTATISSGGANAVSVKLNSRIDTSQNGIFSLSLDVQDPLISPSLTVTATKLKPSGTSYPPTPYPMQHDPSHAWLDTIDFSLAAGMYRIDLVLQDSGTIIWGESQIVYLVPYVSPENIRTVYDREVTVTELGQLPEVSPYVSLNSGVVVDNGGEGTSITMSSFDPVAIIVYALNSTTTLGYDPYTGQPYPGCYIYSGPLTLDSAMDALDGVADSVTYIKAATFNPVGQGPTSYRIYYYSDAVYVAESLPGTRGTASSPYNDLQVALDRARDLNRSMVTDVRATVGQYEGPFTAYDGTRLSGSYAPGTWLRDDSALADPTGYPAAAITELYGDIGTGSTVEGEPAAMLRLRNERGLPAYCEYAYVRNTSSLSNTGFVAAISINGMPGPVVLDHVNATSQAGPSYDSAAITVNASQNVAINASYLCGRSTVSSGTAQTVGLRIINSLVNAASGPSISTTVAAGFGETSGYAFGVFSSDDSVVSLTGSAAYPLFINGSNQNCAMNIGVSLQSTNSAILSFCSVSCSNGITIAGIFFEKSRGNVSDSTVTVIQNSVCQKADGIVLLAPISNYDPLAGFDFIVERSQAVLSGSPAALRSNGIRILGGKARIANNDSIDSGPVSGATGGSFGIELAPDASTWADARIENNANIIGSAANVSAGIKASGKVHAIIESNAAIYSGTTSIIGSSPRRYSIYATGIEAILNSGGASMLEIRNNKRTYGTGSAADGIHTYGFSIEATNPAGPIIVDRNRISGGMGGGSFESTGVFLRLSGASYAADAVFRNNIIHGGMGGTGNYDGMSVYCDSENSGSGRIIIANNTIIAPSNSGAALRMSGYARPLLYNDIFFKTAGTAGYSLVAAGPNAVPSIINKCVFANAASGNYYNQNSASVDPFVENGIFTRNIGVESGILTSLFTQDIPSMNTFLSFKAELGTSNVEILHLGFDLYPAGGPIHPWHFGDDCFGNTRVDRGGWSRGATQAP